MMMSASWRLFTAIIINICEEHVMIHALVGKFTIF